MPFIALCISCGMPVVHAQNFQIPANRDPRFNTFLNPSNDPDIHPRFNPQLNPQFNSKMNPTFNSSINPTFNTAINPYFQPDLNPMYNKELDPKYNPDLNPMYKLSAVVYNLNAQPAALLCVAWPEKVIVEFDLNLNWTGFWVTNNAGGFNFFDTAGQYKEIMMWPNGKGGFNVFDTKSEYLAFVW